MNALSLITAVAAALAVVPSPCAGDWARARSARFEVTSDAGVEEARSAARRLECLQDVLERLLPGGGSPGEPATPVLVLRDGAAFRALVPRERNRPGDVDGFVLSGSDGPRAVVWSEPAAAGAERWRTLDHELVHLYLGRVLPAQPAWLAEGLAVALSAGELDEPEARLGALAPDRLLSLAQGPRLPVAQLVVTDWESPTYRGSDSTAAFYRGSLALVRRLLDERGLPALLAMAGTLASSSGDAGAAFETSFGSPGALEPALLAVSPDPLLRVPAGPPVAVALAETTPAPAEIDALLGEILLEGGHAHEARKRFEAALRDDPGPAHAGLAQLLLQEGAWDEARLELRAAVAARSDDPRLLLRQAQLLLNAARNSAEGLTAAVEAEALAALERAVALDPNLVDAVCLLAHEKPEPLARRIELLARAFARDPGRPDVGLTLAWLQGRRDDVEAARLVLRRSRDAARNETYRFLCNRQLSQLGSYAHATATAHGRLQRLECRRDGSLVFTLATAGGPLRLQAASRRSFFVGGGGGDELELKCGAQDVPVRVRYGLPPATGTAGELLVLEPWSG